MDETPPHPELQPEQAYFDRAADARERQRAKATHPDVASAGIHPKAMTALLDSFRAFAADLGSPDQPVAFGRVDREDGDTFYIGRMAIFDLEYDPLVISWKSELASDLAQSTVADPKGVHMKRSFITDRNTINEIFDEYLTRQEDRLMPSTYHDSLLSALGAGRDGRLRDIVQTIQAKQDEVMRKPADGVLVVQGGPGTGKTIIGLQRLSILIYRERLEPSEMLFVGPNRGFLKYIGDVLPSLGDADVQRVAVTDLTSLPVAAVRREEPSIAKIKGDARMADLLQSAILDRRGTPDSETALRISDRTIRLTSEKIGEILQPFVDGRRPHNVARELIREQMIRLISRTGQRTEELSEGAVRGSRDLENLMTRIWPTFSPQEFLRDLLGSENRLKLHGASIFGEKSVLLIARPAQARISDEHWTDADLALIDEIDVLLNGVQSTPTFRHIVVDEAQDLSPIQLRALGRRAGGAVTILGDLAQATGAWAHRSWDEVIAHLGVEPSFEFELSIGYRVPSEIMAVAAAVAGALDLPVAIPEPIRASGEVPQFLSAGDEPILRTAVSAIKPSLALGLRVGVICTEATIAEIGTALRYESIEWGDGRETMTKSVTVVDPVSSKGLEFDSVVVIEPSDIVDSSPQGLNELFVAITRSTRLLSVVYSRQLPDVLSGFVTESPPSGDPIGHGPPSQPIPAELLDRREAPDSLLVDRDDIEGALVPDTPDPADMTDVSRVTPADNVGIQPTRQSIVDVVLTATVDQVAQEVRIVLSPELWTEFLTRLAHELGDDHE